MSVFTPAEIAYLGSQRLGRIATVGPSDIGGHGFARSKKFTDAQRNPRVAFVVDDLASVSPWRPRGIEVRGIAEVLASGGEGFGRGYDPHIFRVRPRRIASWGLEGERRSATVRS